MMASIILPAQCYALFYDGLRVNDVYAMMRSKPALLGTAFGSVLKAGCSRRGTFGAMYLNTAQHNARNEHVFVTGSKYNNLAR